MYTTRPRWKGSETPVEQYGQLAYEIWEKPKGLCEDQSTQQKVCPEQAIHISVPQVRSQVYGRARGIHWGFFKLQKSTLALRVTR